MTTLAERDGLCSMAHCWVDGTLIPARASHKSLEPKDRSDDQDPSGPGSNARANREGTRRNNGTHATATAPDARHYRKIQNTAAVPAGQGHVLMENCSGLVFGPEVTHADQFGGRAAALATLSTIPASRSRTGGVEKAYDTREFIQACRRRRVTPHVANNASGIRRSAIERRTVRQEGYRLNQIARNLVKEDFG